jgi:hypothetical protein
MVAHGERVDRRRAQALDAPLAEDADRLAGHDGEERQEREGGKPERHPPEPERGGEQIDDQPLQPKPDRQGQQAAERRQKNADPGRASAVDDDGRAIRRFDRLQGFLGDDDGPARDRRRLRIAVGHGDDLGIIKAKGAGSAGHGSTPVLTLLRSSRPEPQAESRDPGPPPLSSLGLTR